MKNNKKILMKFGLYILTFLIIIFIGVSNIFALSNYNQVQFYDNNGSSVTWKTTTWTQQTQESTATFGLTAGSTGGLMVYTLSTPVVNKHIYSMFVNVGTRNYGGYTTLSSKNCIGLGNTLAQATNDYISCTLTPRYSNNSTSTGEYNKGLFFTFIANKNASYIAIPFTSHETVYDVPIYSYGLEMEDNGDSTNMTEQQVSSIVDTQTDSIENTLANIENNIGTNILNSQQAIINNQNANNNALIEANEDNTQNIIDNNNSNTDKIIEDNKKNFQTCRDSVNLFNPTAFESGLQNNKIRNDEGTVVNDSTSSYSTYTIQVKAGQLYSIKGYFQRVYFLNSNSEFVSRIIYNSSTSLPMNATYTPSENGYFQFQIRNSTYNNNKGEEQVQEGSFTTYEPYGEEVCTNKLDEQTNAINGLNDNINDDNTDGATSEASEFFSDFNTNTFGLTSIITAPLNLIQSLTSKTCTPLHLPLPYLNNKYLDLPCMSSIYSQHFGTFFTLYQTITYGIIAYWVCVRIFNHVKDFKNPEHDEIEVVDL